MVPATMFGETAGRTRGGVEPPRPFGLTDVVPPEFASLDLGSGDKECEGQSPERGIVAGCSPTRHSPEIAALATKGDETYLVLYPSELRALTPGRIRTGAPRA